jgi:hypothetical protein
MGDASSPKSQGGKIGQGFRKLGFGFTEDLLAESTPGRQAAFLGAQEALRSGGVNANLPAVRNSLERFDFEQSKRGAALEERIRTAGLEGTPFALRAKAELEQEAGLQRNEVERQAMEQFLRFITLNLGAAGAAAAPFTQAGLTGAGLQSAFGQAVEGSVQTGLGAVKGSKQGGGVGSIFTGGAGA